MLNLCRRQCPGAAKATIRRLATASSRPVPNKFSETLDAGPALDDFLNADGPERVVLGNTAVYVARKHCVHAFRDSCMFQNASTSVSQDPHSVGEELC